MRADNPASSKRRLTMRAMSSADMELVVIRLVRRIAVRNNGAATHGELRKIDDAMVQRRLVVMSMTPRLNQFLALMPSASASRMYAPANASPAHDESNQRRPSDMKPPNAIRSISLARMRRDFTEPPSMRAREVSTQEKRASTRP